MQYAVILSERAQSQLNALYLYIAEKSGELAAENFVGDLLERCRKLNLFPYRGRARGDLYPGLRVTSFLRSVTVAYTIDESRGKVVIQGIFYGGQDFEDAFDP